MKETKELIENGEIVALASNGQGILRKEGLVTFIPFTVPGDLVQYQETKRKKNFALGRLLEVEQSSPKRIDPPCPYYGVCGGCQLQHITYASQVDYKRIWVEEALRKIGKFSSIVVPPVRQTERQWTYRRRVSLVLRKHGKHFQVGYIGIDDRSLVVIQNCAIFIEPQDPIFSAIQEISGRLESDAPEEGKVTVLKNDREAGYLLQFHFKSLPRNADEVLSSSLRKYPFLKGILAASPHQALRFGSLTTHSEIGSLSFEFTPQAFIQNHPEQSTRIYEAIESLARALQPSHALDLYCGIGISSLLLAKQGIRVTGIELNAQAIKLAILNAKRNHITGVCFMAADVEKVLDNILSEDPPDLIIVNPPREGLSPKVAALLAQKPAKQLIYISCMPSTLARDLQMLCKTAYVLDRVEAFDMFPQTVHVETMAVCVRN